MSDPVVTEDGVVRSANAAETLSIPVRDPAAIAAEARDARRRVAFDTTDHAIGTFVEGVVDALSLGLIRETGEEADLRRAANPAEAFAGEVLGFAAGMGISGPVRGVTKAAEKLGAGAAKTVLRAGETSIVTRAASEAAAAMAGAGAQAFDHQLMDSLLEDKEFSSEAILHEVKLAGVLGGVGGVLLGGLAKATSRDIAKQGGIVGNVEEALAPHYEALKAYDGVVERHAAEVGALRQMHKEGLVSAEYLDQRVTALHRAAKARDAIDAINDAHALSGTNDAAYTKWQKANVKYRATVRELDEAMRAPLEGPKNDLPALNQLVDSLPVKPAGPLTESFGFADDAAAAAERGPALVGPRLEEPGQLAWGTVENAKMGPALEAPGQLGWGTVESPLFPVDELAGMSEAKMARMKAKLQESAGERAKFRDMAQGGNLVEAPPAPETPLTFDQRDLAAPVRDAAGKRRADVATGEMAMHIDEGNLAARRPMSANELPDIHQPTGAGQQVGPEAGTGAESPSGKRAAQVADTADTPPPAALDVSMEPPALDIPKPRPLDAAEARVQQAMTDLVAKTGGRLDSAGALDVLSHVGIRPAGDNVGAYMDQVYAMRKAGKLAGATTAKASPLRKALDSVIGGAAGHAMGGPAGAIVGALLFKRGGRVAAAAGRLMAQATGAAQKLITSSRVRAVSIAASNQAYAYSDKGPIKDPVERIQEIKFLAANPEHIAELVAKNATELSDEPRLLQALQARTVGQVQQLALRAPAILFDKLGRPLSPPTGKLREFFEFENAIHDLPGLLNAVASGALTSPQADALRSFPSVHGKVALALLADPDALRKSPREVLRSVERITGIALTGASDPMFLVRQAQAWAPPAPQAPPQAPQAFNINPAGAPTPSQSNATGRAPGN